MATPTESTPATAPRARRPTPTAGRLVAVCPVGHPGGAEIGLLRLLRRLAAWGWDVTVTTPGRGPLRDAVRVAGWRSASLPVGGLGRGEGARAVRSWPALARLARDADVVYLNGTVCGRLLPALRRGRATRVLHVHDVVTRVPALWRRADVVLADSRAVAQALGGLEAHVVGCPVEPAVADLAPPWPAGSGPVIGFIGRIEPRKGVLDLVRAAPAIRAAIPGARVVVVGDDPYGRDPEYVAAVRRSREVEHVPWVDDAAAVMRHLDVLVLPALQEPFGTVLAEAMAAGTPVVATRVGGLAEVVDDRVTGRLVEPGDPPALAAAVAEVCAARVRMGAAARVAARRFDADAYAARVLELIAR